jgi:hypothetical protein
MEIFDAAKALIESMKDFEKATYGDSDDAEHDAAVLMQSDAKALLELLAAKEPRLAEPLKQFEADIAQIEDQSFDDE